MGFLSSANTIYARAYLTEKGREYLFNKNNVRFDASGNDLFEIKTFTLGDADINYEALVQPGTGEVPDISGKNESCLKTSVNYEQRNLLFYKDFDKIVTTNVIYATNAPGNILNINVNTGSNQLPIGPDSVGPGIDSGSGSGPGTIANNSPTGVVNRMVIVNSSTNGSSIQEGHVVFGPVGQNVVSTSILGQGVHTNRKVIPLTTNVGEGAPFLKFTLPRPESYNNMLNIAPFVRIIVTFCVKDSYYKDGYRDFVTSIPQNYIDSLKSWIDNGLNPLNNSFVRYRQLSFTSYGLNTAQIQNAVTFYLRFNYTGLPGVGSQSGSGGNEGSNLNSGPSIPGGIIGG